MGQGGITKNPGKWFDANAFQTVDASGNTSPYSMLSGKMIVLYTPRKATELMLWAACVLQVSEVSGGSGYTTIPCDTVITLPVAIMDKVYLTVPEEATLNFIYAIV